LIIGSCQQNLDRLYFNYNTYESLIKRVAIRYPLEYNISVIPEELKRWRLENNYSQSQLAKALGVIKLTISRWETGERQIPSFLHLALIPLRQKGGGIKVGRPATKNPRRKEVRNNGKRYLQAR
jgi:DNA-binding XRE family transcriptional regulator